MPCSRVFRSSAPSEQLPFPRGRRLGRHGGCGSTQSNGGSAPVRRASATAAQQGRSGRQALGAGPLSGEDRTIGDPELVTRPAAAGTAGRTAGRAQWRACQAGPARRADQLPRRPLAPDHVRDMAAEPAGSTPGELRGQVTDQLAAWPPGPQTAPDQPPASA